MFSRTVYIVFSVGKPDFFCLNNRGVFHKHDIRRGDGVFRRVRKSFCFGVCQKAYERVYKRPFRACYAAVFRGCRFLRLYRFRCKVSYEKEPAFMEAVFRGARQGKEKKENQGRGLSFIPRKTNVQIFHIPKKSACARQFHRAAERGLSELYLADEYRVFDTFRRVGKHS